MTKKYFTELAKYNNWTDRIIIEWLRQITESQWEQTIPSSFSSIEKTTVHMVSAKKIWIDFWRKDPNPIYLSGNFNGTKDELIDIWENASAELLKFIENYSEEYYHQPVTFIYPSGIKGEMMFWQTFPTLSIMQPIIAGNL
ncbi:hypothetical protein ODZ84_05565 [Chryseobacterium fluminis]|uniref:DinB family protein n=1 Tax=Chryseobacterium fluminis TaxID=2983606 RepID=UPI00224D658C|nr:DinB family protein [Chryseobacterium sp. MMS21-Ot14]UZT99040.1 hypothetical protein ODZ84_05565 [Chryseobacterium sp. MMS21-Ot14]